MKKTLQRTLFLTFLALFSTDPAIFATEENSILTTILSSVAFWSSISKYWINLSSHSSLAKMSYISEISCSQNTTVFTIAKPMLCHSPQCYLCFFGWRKCTYNQLQLTNNGEWGLAGKFYTDKISLGLVSSLVEELRSVSCLTTFLDGVSTFTNNYS